MKKRNSGFTLIELMIVVTILAIIVSWGYSSYRDTILKSRRAEGIGELLEIADRMERFYSDQGTYVGANLGTSSTAVHSLCSENNHYCFSIASQTTVLFTITAAPNGGQTSDSCGTFTLGSDGTKTYSGSGTCW